VDPAPSLGAALMMGGAAGQAAQQSQQASGANASSQALEEESTPLAVEAALLEEESGGGSGAGQSNASTGGGGTVGTVEVRTEREYIWGPGEGWGVAGVDELIAQFDRTGALTFAITDAGGDCVAICDAGGPPSGGSARVVGQWTYDAYGNVLSADHIHPHAYSRLGHKGLIFDRLDAGVGPGTGVGVADRGDDGGFTPGQFIGHASCGFDVLRIVPYARGLYHNRNRVYVPELGRFAQADPNASGVGVMHQSTFNGKTSCVQNPFFSMFERYENGANIHGYCDSRPLQRDDVLGLEWTDDGSFDDVILPALSFMEEALPIPVLGMTLSVLDFWTTAVPFIQGYHKFVQDAAYAGEEELDWALDWSQSDDASPRFGGGFEEYGLDDTAQDASDTTFLSAMRMPRGAPRFNPIRMQGVHGERLARTQLQAKPMRRGVQTREGIRHYDGVGVGSSRTGSLGKNTLLEVKDGVSGPSQRVLRQIWKDGAHIRKSGAKIHWQFYLPRGQTLSPALIIELRSNGISHSITTRP